MATAGPVPVLAPLHDADLSRLPPDQQQVHIFQWLRTLERQLATIEGPALKAAQAETEKRMVAVVVQHKPTRPVRELLGRCFVPMYARGDARGLSELVGTLQALLKAPVPKDPKKDTPLQPRMCVAPTPHARTRSDTERERGRYAGTAHHHRDPDQYD
jgi:hypothetical protein